MFMANDGVLSNSILQRPSILIQYMRAIGPGTVLWKSGSDSIRNDGTAHEILKWLLPNYAFQAVPDNHLKFNGVSTETDVDPKQYDLIDQLTDQDNSQYENYRQWSPTYAALKKRKTHLNKYRDDGPAFYYHVETAYQIPQTEPIVVLGSPEGFLGYHHPATGPLPSFRTLLDDCGYSAAIKLAAQCENVGLVLKTPDGEFKKFSFENYLDISLIFLGRTSYGRTVLVLAGSRCSFGTLAATRIACDFWRHPVNEIVCQAMDSNPKPALEPGIVVYRTKWQLRPPIVEPFATPVKPEPDITDASPLRIPHSFKPYSIDEPIAAELLYSSIEPDHNELFFAERSEKLKSLERPVFVHLARENPLVKYLNQGPVSVISKWYPEDLRDDGKAKDLLARKIPSYNYVPIAPGLPIIRNSASFSNEIDTMLQPKDPEKGDWAEIFEYDPQPRALFEFWESLEKYRSSQPQENLHFVDDLNAHFRIPKDGPCIILGAPESFVCYGLPGTQFNELIEKAQYPNRFQFNWKKGEGPLVDRKLDRILRTELSEEDDGFIKSDVGVIYISKTVHQRDLIIVAGNKWLGTLAGVQLLLADNRPEINCVLERYLAGELQTVELAFKCRRVDNRQPPISGQNMHAEADDVGDLDITLINSLNDLKYRWPRKSQRLFEPILNALTNPNVVKAVEVQDDGFVLRSSGSELTVYCPHEYEAGGHKIRPGNKTAAQLETISRLLRQFHETRLPAANFCYPFFILGASGTGKEFIHHFVHKIVGELLTPAKGTEKKAAVKPEEKKKADSRHASAQSSGNTAASETSGKSKDSIITAQNGTANQVEKVEATSAKENRTVLPLRSFNAAAMTPTLLEAELFGHKKGTFNDAYEDRAGAFGDMNGGVLFLDEFLAVAPETLKHMQSALLRVMETGAYNRVGDNIPRSTETHLVLATDGARSKDGLRDLVATGMFSEAFFNRIQGRTFALEPLSERPMEILSSFFQHLQDEQEEPYTIQLSALRRLLFNSWNGNFRDLRTVAQDLPNECRKKGVTAADLDRALGATLSSNDYNSSTADGKLITVNIRIGLPVPFTAIGEQLKQDQWQKLNQNNWPVLNHSITDTNERKAIADLIKIVNVGDFGQNRNDLGKGAGMETSTSLPFLASLPKTSPEAIVSFVVQQLTSLKEDWRIIQADDDSKAMAIKLYNEFPPARLTNNGWAIRFLRIALETGWDVRTDQQIKAMRHIAYFKFRSKWGPGEKRSFPIQLQNEGELATHSRAEYSAYMDLLTRVIAT
ncbi:MAG: sigma 54-interacting transcriptional regulator [Pirellulaceae bacterium]|nr:sigma 54-interacting transcriptional regulator [Pirellulaceae bacterium]